MKILCLSLMCGSNGFTKALKKRAEVIELAPGPNFNVMAAKLAMEHKPDITFIQIQAPGVISEVCAKQLKEHSGKVYNWTGDVRHPIPRWYYDIGQHIDSTLFTNMTDVEQMRKDGLRSDYLEIGFDPEIYKPEGQVTISDDIVYFGNNYGPDKFPMSQFRIDMVNHLSKRDNFGVYGNGWANASGNYGHSQPEEAAAYRGAKIAINVSHFEYKKYSSDRLLRILGTGVMCLCKWYPDAPLIEENDIAYWWDLEDLDFLIDQYLDDPEDRRRIANNGRIEAHKNYTFDNMVDNLIEL